MTNYYRTSFYLLILSMLINGCACPNLNPFPNRDIVFITGGINGARFGFVDADGSGLEFVNSDLYYIEPYWGFDGSAMFMLQFSGGSPIVHTGSLAYWKQGKCIRVCRKWPMIESIGGYIIADDTLQVVIDNAGKEILLVDVNRCKLVKNIYVEEDYSHTWITSISLSPDQNALLYSAEIGSPGETAVNKIYIIDLNTGKREFSGDGGYPSWSPDGTKIAFMKLDGIYVQDQSGMENQILTYDFEDHPNPGEFISPTSSPSWSPDGQWLLYHKFIPINKITSTSAIFKLNINTGEEIKIVDDGKFPSWRPGK